MARKVACNLLSGKTNAMPWYESKSSKERERKRMLLARLTDLVAVHYRTITEFQTFVSAQIKEHETQEKIRNGMRNGGRTRHFEAISKRGSRRWEGRTGARGEKSGERHILRLERSDAGLINGHRLN